MLLFLINQIKNLNIKDLKCYQRLNFQLDYNPLI